MTQGHGLQNQEACSWMSGHKRAAISNSCSRRANLAPCSSTVCVCVCVAGTVEHSELNFFFHVIKTFWEIWGQSKVQTLAATTRWCQSGLNRSQGACLRLKCCFIKLRDLSSAVTFLYKQTPPLSAEQHLSSRRAQQSLAHNG